MPETPPQQLWYALRLRSNFERKAFSWCRSHGIESLLPTYQRESRRHGGPKMLERPLFPGYLIASIDLRGTATYGAEPDDGESRVAIDTTDSGALSADVEGLTLYYGADGTGYLIASIDLRAPEKTTLLQAPGAVELVRFGGHSIPISDQEVESVRILCTPTSGVLPHPFLREGMKVEVVSGPFTGARGFLEKKQGRRPTLVVVLDLFGRAIGVPIEGGMVMPVVDG